MKFRPHSPLLILISLLGWSRTLHAQDTPSAELTPGDLFENLAKETKPLWRQQYREHIERTVTNRDKAAMALGAVMTDLSLAAMARDPQQIRNLLQDEEALEKLLSLPDKMRNFRQRSLALAEANDWPQLAKAIDRAHDRQLELLIGLRDAPLAALVTTGRWLRCWQICTSVVTAKHLPATDLAIGSRELLQKISTQATKLAETSDARHLRLLAHKLMTMTKLWLPQDPPENEAERLRATQEILDELIEQLVHDQVRSAVAPSTPLR